MAPAMVSLAPSAIGGTVACTVGGAVRRTSNVDGRERHDVCSRRARALLRLHPV